MPTESATRKEIIDIRLKEAGWDVADRTQVIEEFFVAPVVDGGSVTSHILREKLLRRVYQHRTAPFLQFIRHILGIEILESFPDTVSRSIDQFIAEHRTLTSHRLQFLNLLRDYLIHRGAIEKRDLIQAPFTIIHPSGIRGVFSPAEIDEILALTQRLAA